jgi:hypothetical protein
MGTAKGCRADARCAAFAFNAKMTGPRQNFLLAHPVNKSRGPRASGLHLDISTGCSAAFRRNYGIAASSTNFCHPIIFACDPAARL